MISALAILIFGTLFFSALLTPWVYTAILSLFPAMHWPFSRVFDRVAMAAALLLLLAVRREFNLEALRAYFHRTRLSAKALRVLAGFCISAASIALLLPLLVSSGKLVWSDQTLGYYLQKALLKAVPAALLVSLIEESLFRVLIFKRLRQRFSVAAAALGSSVVYALVHFIAPDKTFAYSQFDPLAGFAYLGQIFVRYLDPDIYPALFGLLLVGLALCYVIHRTGSLFLCIGLHAGWAAGLKMVKHIAVIAEGTHVDQELGRRYFLLADPLAWCSVVLVFGAVWLMAERLHWFESDERTA